VKAAVPLLAALVAAAATAASASAASVDAGFVVIKDLGRSGAVTEVREKATGRVVAREVLTGEQGAGTSACSDPRHKALGARWTSAPTFYVNAASLAGLPAAPGESSPSTADVRADVVAGARVWQWPFVSDCPVFKRATTFQAQDGGDTATTASLVDGLTTDGRNVIEFRSLAGTLCDGALACTIIDFDRGRIREADMVFERDIARISGLADFWTVADTTWITPDAARFAVVDTSTHEFGHFAGLDHVDRSPQLTMFPLIHDGMQTLGLGDMNGLATRYK
jgi:hypothetical protein